MSLLLYLLRLAPHRFQVFLVVLGPVIPSPVVSIEPFGMSFESILQTESGACILIRSGAFGISP